MSLYRILGIAKKASKQDIKAAYRKLALQFHPDKHSQSSQKARDAAAEKFKKMSAAYETLVDDSKRAAYDLNCKARESESQNKGAGAGAGYPKYEHGFHYSQSHRQTNDENSSQEGLHWRIGRLVCMGLAFVFLVIESAIDREKLKRELDEIRERQNRELEECRGRHERELWELGKTQQILIRHERELEEHQKRHECELDDHRKRHQHECEIKRERRLRSINNF